jgi:hypothetical protein
LTELSVAVGAAASESSAYAGQIRQPSELHLTCSLVAPLTVVGRRNGEVSQAKITLRKFPLSVIRADVAISYRHLEIRPNRIRYKTF